MEKYPISRAAPNSSISTPHTVLSADAEKSGKPIMAAPSRHSAHEMTIQPIFAVLIIFSESIGISLLCITAVLSKRAAPAPLGRIRLFFYYSGQTRCAEWAKKSRCPKSGQTGCFMVNSDSTRSLCKNQIAIGCLPKILANGKICPKGPDSTKHILKADDSKPDKVAKKFENALVSALFRCRSL